MVKLTPSDHVNLGAFVIMIAIVMFSFLTSDFATINPSITGAVVKQETVGDVFYDIGYESLGENELIYAGDYAKILINITNATTMNPLNNAACQYKIGSGNYSTANYRTSKNRYESSSELFSTAGTYQYIVYCNMSSYGVADINDTNSLTVYDLLPDFIIEVDAPGSSSAESNVNISFTITNQGSNFNGNVIFGIDFGDGYEVASQTVYLSGSSAETSILHTYSNIGDYTIEATVDPIDSTSESNENNNEDTDIISIYNSSAQPITCGGIGSPVSMSSDFYCDGQIYFTVDDLTLDCNNYKIYGDGKYSGQRGIYTAVPLTIKDCVISDYEIGIHGNGAITLINSTIKSTKKGIILNATGNNLTRNIFKGNTLAIHNLRESTINNNDFPSNTKHLNTTLNTDFENNYFATEFYQEILDDIINDSVTVDIIPFMNGSVRKEDSVELNPDFDGPELNVSITKEERDYTTKVKIKVNTSENASCKASEKSESYSNMDKLNSTDNIRHNIDISFMEEKTVNIYITCKDTESNPTNFISDNITIRSSIDIALGELKSEIEYYKDQKEDYEDQKDDYKKDLAKEDDPDTKEIIQEYIDELDIEISYYAKLKKYAEDLQDDLQDINNKTEDLQDDYLDEYEEDIYNLTINISDTDDIIEDMIDEESEDIYDVLKDKYNNLKTLYSKYDLNESKVREKKDLRNDHIVLFYEKEKLDMQAEIDRYLDLDELGTTVDYDIISTFEDEIDDLDDDIAEAKEEETIDDYELDIIVLENQITLNGQYKNKLNKLLDQVEDGLKYSNKNDDYKTVQELTILESKIENDIDNLDSDAETLDSDLDKKKEDLSNFESGSTTTTSTGDGNVRITITNATGSKVSQTVNDSTIYLSKATVTLYPQNNESGYIDINKLSSSPYTDEANITTFEWYNISMTADLLISLIQLEFQINNEFLTGLNTTSNDVSLYVYDNVTDGWKIAATTSQGNGTPYTFKSSVTEMGAIALGYLASNGINNSGEGPMCRPNWLCGNYSVCNENGTQNRTCIDANNCSNNNQPRTDVKQCAEETCFDEIENQDEEGVDCGGSCAQSCVTVEKAKTIPETKEKNLSALSIFLVVIIIVSTLGLVVEQVVIIKRKKKKKEMEQQPKLKNTKESKQEIEKQMKKDELQQGQAENAKAAEQQTQSEQKREYFNYQLIDQVCKKLFKYEGVDAIKAELTSQTGDSQTGDYIVQLTNYIFGKLEAGGRPGEIDEEFIKQGWDENEARHIVDYIATQYLVHQMEEYYSISEPSEDENKAMKDMFASEGYSEDLVDKAFLIFEQRNNEKNG